MPTLQFEGPAGDPLHIFMPRQYHCASIFLQICSESDTCHERETHSDIISSALGNLRNQILLNLQGSQQRKLSGNLHSRGAQDSQEGEDVLVPSR